MSAFIYLESGLVLGTGIHLKTFQRVRLQKMVRGVDWDLDGVLVVYSEKGLRKVMELATGGPFAQAALEALQKKCAVPAPAAEAEETVQGVVSKFYANRHLIGVSVPGHKDVVNVRVRESSNFRLRMAVPLVREGEGYRLGRRLPRFPGRW